MSETLSESKIVKKFDRRPAESQSFYERSLFDPMAIAYPSGGERQELMSADEKGVEDATHRLNHTELIDFASDRAVLGLIEDTGDVATYTALARKAIAEKLRQEGISPSEKLGLYSKLLDMNVLQAFDAYHSAAAGLAGESKQLARKGLEAATQQAVIQGAKLLAEMQNVLVELRQGTKPWQQRAADDLLGKMFEVLAITNQRRRLYAEDVFDERVIVNTAGFVDSAAVLYEPNHNFDALEVNVYGEVTGMFQYKTKKSEKHVYDERITIVSGRAAYRFFDNPAPFVESLSIAVQNPDDPRYEPAMKRAVEKVESLFIEDETRLGKAAARELVTL